MYTYRCRICHRELTDQESIDRGIGLCCYTKKVNEAVGFAEEKGYCQGYANGLTDMDNVFREAIRESEIKKVRAEWEAEKEKRERELDVYFRRLKDKRAEEFSREVHGAEEEALNNLAEMVEERRLVRQGRDLARRERDTALAEVENLKQYHGVDRILLEARVEAARMIKAAKEEAESAFSIERKRLDDAAKKIEQDENEAKEKCRKIIYKTRLDTDRERKQSEADRILFEAKQRRATILREAREEAVKIIARATWRSNNGTKKVVKAVSKCPVF